ncbi:MAG: DEAD/DEAH box helicase family protein, partial [Planctomycetota bacterium]
AVHSKYETFPRDHFGLVFLDECHRSYYGDWHGVLEHFAQSGAIRLGLTATPSDKETQSTDRYFCDRGQYQGPVYRYSIRQGEQDEILAQCHHFKFHTNVDLHGVHDMGFDFEPNQWGRAGDVPQRNAMIAEKYFEVIGRRGPIKTIVFAAGIRHAVNLRYALIRQYNELHHARLEEGEEIVTNETPGVIEEPIEQEEETIIDRERGEGKGGDEPPTGGEEPEQPEPQEMIILDVPVTLESSEVLAPALLEDLRRQIESQLRKVISRDGLRERFVQTVYSWCYFKGSTPMDHSFLATMGFDVHTLRDLYGEPEADIEDFVTIALGEADFDLLRRRVFER